MNLPAEAAMRAAGIDEATIRKIQRVLDENAAAIDQAKPPGVAAGSFGGSSAGQVLSSETSTAHEHIDLAMQEIAAGLLAFQQLVGEFYQSYVEADTVAGDDLNRAATLTEAVPTPVLPRPDQVLDAADCTTGEDFTTEASAACELPTATEGDD